MEGIWKVSSSLRIASAQIQVPRRLRFSSRTQGALRHRVEVPYRPECGGWWQLHTVPAETAQAVRIALACSEEGSLLLDGLYDGERIAGTLHVWQHGVVQAGDVPWADAVSEVPVGDFLGTRLFTFWGPPSPIAAAGE